MRKLRTILAKKFPNETFFFAPADIETQILNFGISAPIDILVVGPYQNQQKNYAIAQGIAKEAEGVPGAVDTYIQQVVDAPEIRMDIDRIRAQQLGLTQQNVASSVLTSLASSSLTAPTYYIDPKNGVQYIVQRANAAAGHRLDSVAALDARSRARPRPTRNYSTTSRRSIATRRPP